MSSKEEKEHEIINIIINKEHFRAPKPEMTGKEIKELGGIPPENWLFLEVPGQSEDKHIGDAEIVHLKSGMKFYDLPVGEHGGKEDA